MKHGLLVILMFFAVVAVGQTAQPAREERPPVSAREIRQLAQVADSLMKELKLLFKKELKENELNKYQPERIALVRSYILLFQHFEEKCEVAAIDKKDVIQVFGRPDTLIRINKGEYEIQYSKVIKPYVRIVNIRYRFIFKQNVLEKVRRED